MIDETALNEGKLKELAERLLTHPHPEGSTSVELFVGRLPESLSAELPLPSRAGILGSALHSRRGRPTLLEVATELAGDLRNWSPAYERDLANAGWQGV